MNSMILQIPLVFLAGLGLYVLFAPLQPIPGDFLALRCDGPKKSSPDFGRVMANPRWGDQQSILPASPARPGLDVVLRQK